MADLYIIAAGKGSRMNSAIPKALVPITDKPNLTTTLQQIGHKFDKVFVATNEEVRMQWIEYFESLARDFPELARNVFNIPIESGRGDGHAVLETIIKTRRFNPISNIVVAWGDVFFPSGGIIDELLAADLSLGLVPVNWEKDPYVTIKVDDKMAVTHAEFSKFGEVNDEGYHDQSVFRFNRLGLEDALSALDAVLNRNGKYITANGELSLLHVFHYIKNITRRSVPEIQAFETQHPTMSFNTIEEVATIQQEINRSWHHKNRNPSS